MDGLDGAQCILSKDCGARVNSCLDSSVVRNVFSFHDGCSTTYNSGLQGCIEAEASSYHQDNGWHYAHGNESKLPLDSECHNICREEKRDALDECEQFLGNTLIDTVAIWELLSATENCVVDDHVLIVTCVAGDPLPPLSKCHTSCLSRLSRNAFLKERVVLVAAIHMQSVAT